MRRVLLSKVVACGAALVVGAALAGSPVAEAAGAASAAGAKPKPKPRPGDDGVLHLGQLAPDTGELSPIVQSLRVPVQLAIDEINAAGGTNGQPVVLVPADDGSAPEIARSSFDALVATGRIDALIGPSTSPSTLGILEKIRTQGVLTCSGSNTADELSLADSKGYYFRTSPPDRLQGQALADLLLSDGHHKVAILERNDTYGVDLAKSLKTALAQAGAKVVADVSYDPKATTFDRPIARVAAKKPDALVLIALTDDGPKVVQALVAAGLGPAQHPVYTVDGMQSVRFAGDVDPADPGKVAGIKGTAPAAAPAGVESPFQARLTATGTDAVFSAYYYDCTILTALASEKAKSDDPAKMKKAFTENLRGKRDCNTYAACKKALDAGKTIHWRGASSNFDQYGAFEPERGVYDVWSYDAAGRVQNEDSSSQITVG